MAQLKSLLKEYRDKRVPDELHNIEVNVDALIKKMAPVAKTNHDVKAVIGDLMKIKQCQKIKSHIVRMG